DLDARRKIPCDDLKMAEIDRRRNVRPRVLLEIRPVVDHGMGLAAVRARLLRRRQRAVQRNLERYVVPAHPEPEIHVQPMILLRPPGRQVLDGHPQPRSHEPRRISVLVEGQVGRPLLPAQHLHELPRIHLAPEARIACQHHRGSPLQWPPLRCAFQSKRGVPPRSWDRWDLWGQIETVSYVSYMSRRSHQRRHDTSLTTIRASFPPFPPRATATTHPPLQVRVPY